MFYPDGSGMGLDEVFLRGTMGWCEHAFERVGSLNEVDGVDSLGDKQESELDDSPDLPCVVSQFI